MQPTTLLRAMGFLADFTGKSLVADRDFLVGKVNEIRRAKWKFEAARHLLFKTSDCACVECYADTCTACRTTFTGITLPVGVVSLTYLEANGIRVDMTNERLANGGCCASTCGCLKAETLVRRAPMLHDIPANYKGTVVFTMEAPEDKKKRIGVEYVGRDGKSLIREDIEGDLQPGKTTSQSVLRFEKVTFPERCGFVKVMTTDGYELGRYHPAISAPSHYRIRLTGVAAGNLVSWEGLKEPQDVRFDSDQVEWSDPLDWKNDYQWLSLHFQTNKSPSEASAYQASAALSKAGVESELQATMPVPSATLRPSGVSSLRRKIRRLQRW